MGLRRTTDSKVLELLRNSGENLDRFTRMAERAVCIRSLPPLTPTKTTIHDGWGKGKGVYLPAAYRFRSQHYAQALMVAIPDGMELFSRFYAPAYCLFSRQYAEVEPLWSNYYLFDGS
jgi:hypothetical protein